MSSRKFRWTSILVIFLLIAYIFVYASPRKLTVLQGTFEETYQRGPLSYQGLFGVLAAGGTEEPDPTRLTVWLPKHSSRKLWIDIESADGLYRAKAEYDVADICSCKCLLEFPTRYNSKLKGYSSEELAVLATLHQVSRGDSDSTDSIGEGVVVASWDSSLTLDSLVILFSSGEAPFMELVTLTDRADTIISCRKARSVNQRHRSAYDAQCRIVVKTTLRLETAIIIRQNLYGIQLGEIPVPILLP